MSPLSLTGWQVVHQYSLLWFTRDSFSSLVGTIGIWQGRFPIQMKEIRSEDKVSGLKPGCLIAVNYVSRKVEQSMKSNISNQNFEPFKRNWNFEILESHITVGSDMLRWKRNFNCGFRCGKLSSFALLEVRLKMRRSDSDNSS